MRYLRVNVLGAPAAVSLCAVDIVAAGIPSLTITNETVSPLRLLPTVAGSELRLQWFGSGTLLQSPNLKDWTVVPGATSPYTTTTSSGAQQFYRVRQ